MPSPGMYGRLGKVPRRTKPNRTVHPPTEGSPATLPSNVRTYASGDTPVATHDWLIPDGVQAGDMILVAVNIDDDLINTIPAGYTKFGDGGNATSSERLLYYKIADGTETSTTFTTVGDAECAATFWRIASNGATLSAPVITDSDGVLGGGTGDGNALHPGPVTVPSAGEYWVFVAALVNKGAPDPDEETGVSAGYANFSYHSSNAPGVTQPKNWIFQAQKTISSAEDPGDAGWADTSGSRYYVTFTFAVAVTEAAASVAAASHTHVEADVTDLNHTDTAAIHDNVAGEIAAVPEKTAPVSADLILIEDSAASNAKKRVQIGNLPGGGGGTNYRGVAQIDDPDTSVTVNHNLGLTPGRGELQVTPKDTIDGWLTSACSKFAIGTVGSATFNINVDAAPGVGKHAAFDWLYVAASVAPTFDPETIAGLRVWLDASEITGLADNDPVSSWANLVAAESENFTQATSGNRPVYRTGIQNALPAVRFDGTDDHLDGSVSRTLKPVTMFAAVSFSSVSGIRNVVGNVSNNSALVWHNNGTAHRLVREATAVVATANTAVAAGTAYQLDASYSSTGAYLFGRNGSDDGSGTNDGTVNASAICIGARDSGSEFLAGDIFEILIYDSVLTTGDRQAVRDYLTDKWAI